MSSSCLRGQDSPRTNKRLYPSLSIRYLVSTLLNAENISTAIVSYGVSPMDADLKTSKPEKDGEQVV